MCSTSRSGRIDPGKNSQYLLVRGLVGLQRGFNISNFHDFTFLSLIVYCNLSCVDLCNRTQCAHWNDTKYRPYDPQKTRGSNYEPSCFFFYYLSIPLLRYLLKTHPYTLDAVLRYDRLTHLFGHQTVTLISIIVKTSNITVYLILKLTQIIQSGVLSHFLSWNIQLIYFSNKTYKISIYVQIRPSF